MRPLQLTKWEGYCGHARIYIKLKERNIVLCSERNGDI